MFLIEKMIHILSYNMPLVPNAPFLLSIETLLDQIETEFIVK